MCCREQSHSRPWLTSVISRSRVLVRRLGGRGGPWFMMVAVSEDRSCSKRATQDTSSSKRHTTSSSLGRVAPLREAEEAGMACGADVGSGLGAVSPWRATASSPPAPANASTTGAGDAASCARPSGRAQDVRGRYCSATSSESAPSIQQRYETHGQRIIGHGLSWSGCYYWYLR